MKCPFKPPFRVVAPSILLIATFSLGYLCHKESPSIPINDGKIFIAGERVSVVCFAPTESMPSTIIVWGVNGPSPKGALVLEKWHDTWVWYPAHAKKGKK